MINSITDYSGNTYEFNSETGLISRGSVILSGEDYEPCFLNSPGGPVFTGIYFKKTDQVLCLSGKLNKLTPPETL